jgi:large subunit ribosomal protein L18
MSEHLAKKTKAKRDRLKRAHFRLRKRVAGTAERPRLAVHKTLRYIYAQVIDDQQGHTLVQANSREASILEGVKSSPGGCEAAKRVGEVLAERAREKGVESVVFDRGGAIYHGKVKAVADGAREKGLKF